MNLAKRVILIAKLIQLKENFSSEEIFKATPTKIKKIIYSKIRNKDLNYIEILEEIIRRKRLMKKLDFSIIFDNLLSQYLKHEKITKRSKKYKEYIEKSIDFLKKYNYNEELKELKKKYKYIFNKKKYGTQIGILDKIYDYKLKELEDFNQIIEISEYIHYLRRCIEFKVHKNGSDLSNEEIDLIKNNRLNRSDLEIELIKRLNIIWKLIKRNSILEDNEKIEYLNSNFELVNNFNLRLKISLLKKEYTTRRENIDRGSEELQEGFQAIFNLNEERSLDLRENFDIFKIYCNKRDYNKFRDIIINSDDFNYISSGIDKSKEELKNIKYHFIVYSANKKVPKRIFDDIIKIYNLRRDNENWDDPLISIDFKVRYLDDKKRIYNSVRKYNNLIKILGAKGIYKNKIDRYNINRPLKRISIIKRQYNRNFYKNLEILSSVHSNLYRKEGKINRGEKKLIELLNSTQIFHLKDGKIGIIDFMIKLITNKDFRKAYFLKFKDFFIPFNHYSNIPYQIKRRVKIRYLKEALGNLINFREYIYNLKDVVPSYLKYLIRRYKKDLRIIRIKIKAKRIKTNKIMEERDKIKYLKPYKRINNQIIKLFETRYKIEDKIDFWRNFNQLYETRSLRYLREYLINNFERFYHILDEIIDKKILGGFKYRRVNFERKFSSCIKLGILFRRLENLNIKLGDKIKAGDALSYFRELDQLKSKKRSYGAFPIMKMIIDICNKSDLNYFLKEIYFLLDLRSYIIKENNLII